MGKTVNTHVELADTSFDADDDAGHHSEVVPSMRSDRMTLKVPEHPVPLESEARLRLTTVVPALDSAHDVDLGWFADDGASNHETAAAHDRPSARPTLHPSHRPTRRVPEAVAPSTAKTAGERESRGSYAQIVGRRRST
jgi:hypothetical protein